MHLLNQRIGRVELALFPQPRHEFDVNIAAIDISIEVKDMYFKKRFDTVERRSRAYAGDTVERRIAEPGHSDGEDTHDRTLPSLKVHIRRRNSRGHDPAFAQESPFPTSDTACQAIVRLVAYRRSTTHLVWPYC